MSPGSCVDRWVFTTSATWETLLIGYIPIQNKKFNLKKKRQKIWLFLYFGEKISNKGKLDYSHGLERGGRTAEAEGEQAG